MGPRCKHHPAQAAGWKCTTCEADLCPDCVYLLSVGHMGSVQLPGCSHCGNGVDVITRHRRRVSFTSRLPHAFRFVFNTSGLLTTVGTAFVVWVMANAGCIGAGIGFGILWAVIMTIIRQTGDGKDEVMLDFGDPLADIGYPALIGLMGTAIVWGPAAAYAWNRSHGGPLLLDPIFWLLLLAGLFYAPMAIILAATRSPFGSMLNPLTVLRYALKLGSDYVVTVALIVGLNLVGLALGLAVGWLIHRLPHVPVISDWVTLSIALVPSLISAHVLGLLLLTRGDDVGWGDGREYFEPVLKGVEPRGPAWVRPEDGSPRTHAPIELDEPSAPPMPQPRSYAPIALEPEAPPPAPAPLDPAALPPLPALKEQVEAAIAEGHLDQALELYKSAAEPPLVSPELHVRLGQAAVARNELQLAVKAFRAGSKDPALPETPKAMVLLARVYAEKLGQGELAIRLFEFVVQKYPGTPAAEFAKTRLLE